MHRASLPVRIAACLLLAGLVSAGEAGAPVGRRDDARATAASMLAAYVFVAHGSGVVISPDGLVLTNHHVIDGERNLEARFADGVSYPARLLGTDPVGDIALLKIDAKHPLPYASLAPAEALIPGMDVIAIGNPFGLGDLDSTPSLSRGVLSTARVVRDDYTDALQLDAPVNPGNSGGPLFDSAGRVLGINGQIRTLSGMRVNSGVGLAIASTQLAAFLPLLAEARGGYVHHTAKPRALALEQRADGVYIAAPGVAPLVGGERLLAVAGRAVTSLANAEGLFESLPWTPEATVALSLRESGGVVVERTLPAARRSIPGKPYHGLVVDQAEGNLLVGSVDDDSPASIAELQAGDVVLEANGRSIARKLDFLKAMVKLEIGDWLELKVRSADGAERMVRFLLKMKP